MIAAVPAPWPILATLIAAALMVFGLAWELFLDPLRPGGSWLALKVLPLALALRGLHAGRIYTYKWMSLVIWIYVGEALVRVAGLTPSERLLAWNSLALSTEPSPLLRMEFRNQLIKQCLRAECSLADLPTPPPGAGLTMKKTMPMPSHKAGRDPLCTLGFEIRL